MVVGFCVQVVDQVYDDEAAKAMLLKKGTVCIMIHTGSRGLGHQVQQSQCLPGHLASAQCMSVQSILEDVPCHFVHHPFPFSMPTHSLTKLKLSGPKLASKQVCFTDPYVGLC